MCSRANVRQQLSPYNTDNKSIRPFSFVQAGSIHPIRERNKKRTPWPLPTACICGVQRMTYDPEIGQTHKCNFANSN